MIKRSRGKGRKKVQELDRAKEFMMAIDDLGKEKGIAPEVLFDAIEAALISAYRRNFGSEQNAHVQIDRTTGEFHVYAHKTVAREVTDPVMEMALEDAQALDPDYEEGDVLEIEVTPANFGRIAAQTAQGDADPSLSKAEDTARQRAEQHHFEQFVIAQRISARLAEAIPQPFAMTMIVRRFGEAG